ncbi:MAG: histidine kinase, partial [Bacteroidota bacterium]
VMDKFIFTSNFNFYLYFTIISVVYAYMYFEKKRSQEFINMKLQNEFQTSKINALQSQLQPHFLFNALNGISSLSGINPNKAQDAISDLSDFLRLTLRLNNNRFHTLEEEIFLLSKYLEVEKFRYGRKLETKIDITESLKTRKVPPLLLQPIAENSIKHGFSENHDVLNLEITAKSVDERIKLVVSNNGILLHKFEYGYGLSNLVERLNTLYSKNYSFKMFNSEGKHVVTEIIIP